VPRGNAYPVVTSMASSTRGVALTIAYTYPHIPAPSALQRVGAVAGGGVPMSVDHPDDALRACMRFGCGARLPAHVLGDVCSACAGAGFVRPPVQKRVPRRATDHTRPRPRESRDLVRAVSRHLIPGPHLGRLKVQSRYSRGCEKKLLVRAPRCRRKEWMSKMTWSSI
jgi:hypothetical protein